jgi:hypothetical protein
MAAQCLATGRLAASPAAANQALTVSVVGAEKYSVAVPADVRFCADCGHIFARHDPGSGGEHRCLDGAGAGEVRLWNGPAVALIATVITLVVVGWALLR